MLHIFHSLCIERQAQGLHASWSMHTLHDSQTCRLAGRGTARANSDKRVVQDVATSNAVCTRENGRDGVAKVLQAGPGSNFESWFSNQESCSKLRQVLFVKGLTVW